MRHTFILFSFFFFINLNYNHIESDKSLSTWVFEITFYNFLFSYSTFCSCSSVCYIRASQSLPCVKTKKQKANEEKKWWNDSYPLSSDSFLFGFVAPSNYKRWKTLTFLYILILFEITVRDHLIILRFDDKHFLLFLFLHQIGWKIFPFFIRFMYDVNVTTHFNDAQNDWRNKNIFSVAHLDSTPLNSSHLIASHSISFRFISFQRN